MDLVRIVIFALCLSAWVVRDVTPLSEVSAVKQGAAVNASASHEKDTKIPELKNDNLNKTMVTNLKKDNSNIPRNRKVTSADNVNVTDIKNPTKIEVEKSSDKSLKNGEDFHAVKVSDSIVVNVPITPINDKVINKTSGEDKDSKANQAKVNNSITEKENVENVNKNKTEGTNLTKQVEGKPSTNNGGSTKEVNGSNTTKVPTSTVNNNSTKPSGPQPTSSTTTTSTKSPSSTSTSTTTKTTSTTTSTTTTTTTTSTTTTTTTPKPKKPKVAYSVEDFPELDKESLAIHNLTHQKETPYSPSKFPLPDAPYAQPSQEFNKSTFHGGRDYIVPIVSMIFIIPLVIGILITTYRRFRDCWSTRHYRRMDFLVDGMYND